jgi:carbon monoxide dehydrogenase subunit G
MFRLSVAVLLPALALAQLTPNSVTATASRPNAGQPDTVRFNLTLGSSASATREDVLAVLAGVSVTAANFTGVYSYGGSVNPELTWSFVLTAPLSNLKATIALLTALQNNLAKDKKYSLSFSVSGSDASSGDCKFQDLIADARSQAAKLASAANMSVGAILSITGATTSEAATATGIATAPTVSAPSCSITVRFALTGGV